MATLLDGVLADLGLTDVSGPRLAGDPQPAVLASPLAVADCAIASVAACLTAAADLAAARTGRRPDIGLDTEHVAAAVRSEVWLRDADGRGSTASLPCLDCGGLRMVGCVPTRGTQTAKAARRGRRRWWA